MNTEINFLKREPSKRPVYLLLSCIFVLLMAIVLVVLLNQKTAAEKHIAHLETEISRAEDKLIEMQEEQSSVKGLQELIKMLSAVEAEMTPTVQVYHDILQLLEDPENLLIYDMNMEKELTIELTYGSLQEVADIIKQLADKAYIADVILESSVKAEDIYSASLSIMLDDEKLKKEFIPDEG